MIECLSSHTNVAFQPSVTGPRDSGINPYALGFGMFTGQAHLQEADRGGLPVVSGDRRLPPSARRCHASTDRVLQHWEVTPAPQHH